MSQPPDQQSWENWFQDVWAYREDVVYRELFGTVGPHVHTLTPELFARLGQPEPDPRWLVHGVFEIAPSEKLPYYTYVSTALSNPWGENPEQANPAEPSGLGFELLMHTPQQANWAIQVLHWLMAVNILAASGLLQGDTIAAGARVPLHTSIDPLNPASAVKNLLILEPVHLKSRFQLPSGTVDFLLCQGITDEEMGKAQELDYNDMLGYLQTHGIYPVTDASRTA